MPSLSLMIKPVSDACALRCDYCFYADEMKHRQEGGHPPMALDTLEKVIRRGFAYGADSIHFVFQGGEPTLARLPFFQDVVLLQRQYNGRRVPVHNSIQTNGIHLDHGWVNFFLENNFLVGLSMDGCAQVHDVHRRDGSGNGTFTQVMAAADMLHEGGVPCNILAVVTDIMVAHQREALDTLSQFGYVQLIPCMDALDAGNNAPHLSTDGWADFLGAAWLLYRAAAVSHAPISIRIFDNFLRIIRGGMPDTCAMAGSCAPSFMVESNGDVYPCDFYGVDGWKLGNIHQQNFRTIGQSARQAQFLQRSRPVPESCRRCPHYPLCRNGCMRDRDTATGINRWCSSMKAFLSRYTGEMQALARTFDPNESRAERRSPHT